MNTLYVDSPLSDDQRRRLLYQGQLFVFSPTPNSMALVNHARELIQSAFGSLDPTTAQDHMPVEEYAKLLTDLKPKFIHHPKSKEFVKGMLADLGCDLNKTYFDVPRMRTATSNDYLSSGIAYAFHPHRDTWYSAPSNQLNWWLPIYEIESANSMAFHPRYWKEGVKNGSKEFNYYEWNATSRKNAAQFVKEDTRKQPHAEQELELDPQIRIIPRVGGPIVFSGAQMHSTVPNDSGKTRFSIDFRTVNIDDVIGKIGAPNVDSECTGTTMRDYMRASDLAHLPEDAVALYDSEPDKGELVFKPR